MNRSIIKISQNAYAISLPTSYVKLLNLKKGQRLNTIIVRDKLLIDPQREQTYVIKSKYWKELSNVEKIKVLRFLNFLGYKYVIVPSVHDLFIEHLNVIVERKDDKFIISFNDRSEIRELNTIISLNMILLSEIKNLRFNHELVFNILRRLKKISFINLINELDYDFEKYLIVSKIIDALNESINHLNYYFEFFSNELSKEKLENSLSYRIMRDIIDMLIMVLKAYKQYIQNRLPLNKMLLFVIKSIRISLEKIMILKKKYLASFLVSLIIAYDIFK